MTRWTPEQVAKLAPDDASLAAARKLAKPGPWSDTGSTDTLVWGKCQGSGRTPYQTSIDLNGPAFRCSCPSRKFPCKHGLALLLLWVDGSGTVADGADPADFASDWVSQRAERASRSTQEKKAVDPVAQAKRREDRIALMSAGVEDFALWLGDLMRSGSAAARNQPSAWWENTAARLVDSQLPGLAEQVRTMSSEIHGRPDWAEHLLVACGEWWTMTRAWLHREALDPDALGDLRAALGWAYAKEEIRRSEAVQDSWLTLGAHRTEDGRLQQQRTWLWGETSHEIVQILDFAAAGQALAVPQVVGSVIEASVARYPGTAVRRATFVTEPVATTTRGGLPAGTGIRAAVAGAARSRGANPWLRRVPVVLTSVRAAPAHVVDADGAALGLSRDSAAWDVLALTGGHRVDLFGELDSGTLRPLSVVVDGELVGL